MGEPQTIAKVTTRAQKDMALALKLVADVQEKHESGKRDGTKGRYQSLCQEFAVMVRTMGLCQTLAFCESKKGSGGGLPEAHDILLNHVKKILGFQIQDDLPRDGLLQRIQDASASEYMHHTRRVLEAWVYFKRFAKSVLTVED
ncbi:MAG: type III-B CRISPR module-associated protein Cmr5 [Thermaceae bacterium]|nr:type III-B CRISPR module-associated protein Cmr5 [Thermaceae bacterium]